MTSVALDSVKNCIRNKSIDFAESSKSTLDWSFLLSLRKILVDIVSKSVRRMQKDISIRFPRRACASALDLCRTLHESNYLVSDDDGLDASTFARLCLEVLHGVTIRPSFESVCAASLLGKLLFRAASGNDMFSHRVIFIVSDILLSHDPEIECHELEAFVQLMTAALKQVSTNIVRRIDYADDEESASGDALDCGCMALFATAAESESPRVRRAALMAIVRSMRDDADGKDKDNTDNVSQIITADGRTYRPLIHGALLLQLLRKDRIVLHSDEPIFRYAPVEKVKELRTRSRGALLLALEDEHPAVRAMAVECVGALVNSIVDATNVVTSFTKGESFIGGGRRKGGEQRCRRRARRFAKDALQSLSDLACFDNVVSVRTRALDVRRRAFERSDCLTFVRLAVEEISPLLVLLDDASLKIRHHFVRLLSVSSFASVEALTKTLRGCLRWLKRQPVLLFSSADQSVAIGASTAADHRAIRVALASALVKISARNAPQMNEETVLDTLVEIVRSAMNDAETLLSYVSLANHAICSARLTYYVPHTMVIPPDGLAAGASVLALVTACRASPIVRSFLPSDASKILRMTERFARDGEQGLLDTTTTPAFALPAIWLAPPRFGVEGDTREGRTMPNTVHLDVCVVGFSEDSVLDRIVVEFAATKGDEEDEYLWGSYISSAMRVSSVRTDEVELSVVRVHGTMDIPPILYRADGDSNVSVRLSVKGQGSLRGLCEKRVLPRRKI
eukprot:g1681.t1